MFRFGPDLWSRRRPNNPMPERREQALQDCRRNQNSTRINTNNSINNRMNSVQFTVSQDHQQNGTLTIQENSGEYDRDRDRQRDLERDRGQDSEGDRNHEDPPPAYENPPSYQQIIDEWIEENGNLI